MEKPHFDVVLMRAEQLERWGHVAFGEADYASAAEKWERAREIYRTCQDDELDTRIAALNQNLGVAYLNLGILDRALKQTIEARSFYLAQNSVVDVAETNHNLGNIYVALEQFDKAFELYYWAREQFQQAGLANKVIELNQCIAIGRASRGNYYSSKHFYAAALQEFILARDIFRQLRDDGNVQALDRAISEHRAWLRNHPEFFSRGLCLEEDIPPDFRADMAEMRQLFAQMQQDPQVVKVMIQIFERILRQSQINEYPAFRAVILHNMGTAFVSLETGDRAANLARAIAYYREASRLCSPEVMPYQYAMTQSSLGVAYANWPKGERARYLEQAIECYKDALRFYTPETAPFDYAGAQHNLGVAYAQLPKGDREENLRQAITCYQKALTAWICEVTPVEYARTQNCLGNAYRALQTGGRETNLERAIHCYREALHFVTAESAPYDYALVQSNLGAAYASYPRDNLGEYLRQAIECYSEALRFYTLTTPLDYTRTQRNLGLAYIKRCNEGDIEKAISAFQSAILGAQAAGVKDDEYDAAVSLGNLCYLADEWSPTYEAYNIAITALESMRTEYLSETSKTRWAEEVTELFSRMVNVCIHLEQQSEALERAEAAKGRLFLDQLGTDAFPTPSLPPAQQILLERETKLLSELRDLEHNVRRVFDSSQRSQFTIRLEETRETLHSIWTQLEPHAPDYVALRRGDPVQYDDLQALVDDFGSSAALVEFYTLPNKIIVFSLLSGEREPAVAQVDVSQDQLLRHVQNYWREVVEYSRRGNIGQRWQDLAKPLLAHVLPYLQGAELVYLVPHGLLHYLPLHALRVDSSYLIDRFPVAYAPSAAVLNRVVQRRGGASRTGQPRALVAGNPTLDLPHAETEARQVAQLFGVQPYLGGEASKTVVQSELTDKDVVHLACHGYFHPTRPLQSDVIFSGEEALTAQEIMGLRLQADIVTLSACETGRSEVRGGDELVGLTRALLYAGASSVLVSLWRVHDESTERLMTNFYHRLYDNTGRKVKAEAVALREAMLEMREEKEHPYYWAPFVLVGDWQ